MIKKKKKNKFVPMLVLLAVFALLLIGYTVLSAANKKAEEERLASETEDEPIMIAEYDYTAATELSYTNEAGETFTFVSVNGAWSLADDEKFPLNTETVAYMASAISSIAVECTVDGGEAGDYGLDTPSLTVNVKYSDSSSHEYRIGDYNSFTDSYYFMADGELYMISDGLSDYFDYDLDSLIILDEISADISSAEYITDITVISGGEGNSVSDSDGISALWELISALDITNWRDYYADENERESVYALDGGTSVVVTYKKAHTSTDADGNASTSYLSTSYTLFFGNEDGEGGVYFTPEDSQIVYSAPEDDVQSILSYLTYAPAESDTAESETVEVAD